MGTPVKIPAEVEKIIQHEEGVKTFIMKPLKSCPNFKPGQFLHLAIDEYDPSFHWPESRIFSIGSSPTRRDRIRVTFAVKGTFTNRMCEEVCENQTLWLKLPHGSFSFPDNDKDVVLIAGGTGITPFISFLEYVIDKKIKNKITLYYGVRNPRCVIFESILQECESQLKNYQCEIYMENNTDLKNSDKVRDGVLPISKILSDNITNKNNVYYISGPKQMIFSFKSTMIDNKIPENNIMIDEWE